MQFRAFALSALFVVSLASPGRADPRGDTLAGISRCAGIPDDRTFLDCVYGAAQPMRARLGLPPAPANQIRLVPPPQGQQSLSQSALSPRANALAATQPPAKASGWFGGLFGSSAPALHMASYVFDNHGKFTVTLSDGEVWKQAANDTNYANWGGPAAEYIVTLVATADDTKMDVKGEGGPYSVQRVR